MFELGQENWAVLQKEGLETVDALRHIWSHTSSGRWPTPGFGRAGIELEVVISLICSLNFQTGTCRVGVG